MYISYGSTDPSIVRYFSKRVPRSLSTTSGQFVIDSATVAAWRLRGCRYYQLDVLSHY